MKRVLAAAIAALLPCAALAQTPPAGPAGNLWANTLQVGAASASASCLGTAIGCLLGPLVNYQSSNNPGLVMNSPSRLIIARGGTGGTADNATLHVLRATTFSGGTTANVNPAILATTTPGPNVADQEVAIQGLLNTNSTAGGFGIAGWFQAQRNAGSSQWIWGGLIAARDLNTADAVTSGAAVLGLEVDVNGVRADNATNSGSFGNVGIRKAIQIAIHRQTADSGIQYEVSTGLWFTTGGTAGSGGTGSGAADVNYDSAIGFQNSAQARIALDTRGMVAPTGSTDPVYAVTMPAGQCVDFNGSASLTSNPGGNTLCYDNATSKLKYYVGGVAKWSVDAAGNMRVAGTVTPSVAP